MTASPISLSDLFTAQNMGMGGQYPAPMAAQPMSGPQNVQLNPDMQHIQNVVNTYQQNQSGQDTNGFLQQILSNRLQPDLADTSRSVFQSNQAGQYISPDQSMAARISSQLAPYTEAVGLQQKQAEAGLQNAQAGYYGSALQRDLASKAYEYANDPARMQALMMAKYMQGLSGGGQPSAPVPQPIINGVAGTPAGSQLPSMPLNQAMASNAPTSSGGGFNPMGAMLAKSLGLTDMQIGPNGQPMPIPGSMKIENGEVVQFGPNGIPTKVVPKNPAASQNIEDTAQYIMGKLGELKSNGDAVSEGQPFYQNVANSLGNTKTALDFRPGSKAASIIGEMAKYTMQALPDYMQAKGITPGMERTVEGQRMVLNAIGIDPTSNIETSIEGLKNLSKIAGTGQFYKQSAINDANDAIAKGADANAVMGRLRQMGIQ